MPMMIDNVKRVEGVAGFPNDVTIDLLVKWLNKKNMNFLLGALATALRLIVFVVLQFNSISNPHHFIVHFLEFYWGPLWHQRILYAICNYGSMMGILSLSGIVVNNGVVLIDYTQLLILVKKKNWDSI